MPQIVDYDELLRRQKHEENERARREAREKKISKDRKIREARENEENRISFETDSVADLNKLLEICAIESKRLEAMAKLLEPYKKEYLGKLSYGASKVQAKWFKKKWPKKISKAIKQLSNQNHSKYDFNWIRITIINQEERFLRDSKEWKLDLSSLPELDKDNFLLLDEYDRHGIPLKQNEIKSKQADLKNAETDKKLAKAQNQDQKKLDDKQKKIEALKAQIKDLENQVADAQPQEA